MLLTIFPRYSIEKKKQTHRHICSMAINPMHAHTAAAFIFTIGRKFSFVNPAQSAGMTFMIIFVRKFLSSHTRARANKKKMKMKKSTIP